MDQESRLSLTLSPVTRPKHHVNSNPLYFYTFLGKTMIYWSLQTSH